MKSKLKSPIKKNISNYYLRILSRHPSVRPLKNSILTGGKIVVWRHGSTTEGGYSREINSVKAVATSADKLRMKEAFDKAGVRHATWISLSKAKTSEFKTFLEKTNFPKNPLIIKHRWASRGEGNTFVKTQEELDRFLNSSRELKNYIIEQYKTYASEYRIHVDSEGCFYTCRKMIKKDTPKSERFQRHSDNCVWIVETNPDFDKPSNWNDIVSDCVKALKAIGGDVLAFDLKCTSRKNSKNNIREWILIESCSAPSMGDITAQKYRERLPQIIKRKYANS